MTDKKPIVVVLGMHRSGTSAIARGLQAIGVDLGEALLGPSQGDNDKGFWEDVDINAFEERLLARLGSAYDKIAVLDFDPKSPALAGERQEARLLLASKLRDKTVFGFKNPRTSVLAGFWRCVFDDLGLDDRYVIAVRNPMEVAASLKRRNNFGAVRSLLLWTKYTLSALVHTRGRPRVVVAYEAMLENPERELRRMAAALSLPSPDASPDALGAYREEFLSDSLRRFSIPANEVERSPDAPGFVADLYRLVSSLAALPGDGRPEIPEAALDQISAYYADFDPLLRHTDFIEEHFASALDRVGAAETANRRAAAELADRAARVEEQAARIRELDAALEAARRRDEARDRDINEWTTHARQLEAALDEARGALAATRASLSWRATAPLRLAGLAARHPVRAVRAAVSLASRGLWRMLPLSPQRKGALRDAMFERAAPLFRWSATYRLWEEEKKHRRPALRARAAEGDYVPLTAQAPLSAPAARLIAFYLPQFHPIPENDEWWGEGFTEWSNVKPAEPQFEGHYQPRVPGELGYYDLVEQPWVRRRQAELAKLHGVEAFCFYAYWFGGKRLLEQPVADFASDPEIDLPFCLCWANENWSRRWDGLDQEILIAQDHSPEDDLGFIEWAAAYLRNPRYLRVGGRPLLLVYRPSLLPAPRETAARWRAWCRENGVGEIYLAYAQSFETVDPALYDFDAAIEFPPNNMGLAPLEGAVKPLRDDYDGKVYDWTSLAKRSEAYPEPAYKLFRGVNPSWDNTARRKNKGTVLAGSSPAAYGRWLRNAVEDARRRFQDPDERLIFVNAWNEWAEGAYLEPDERYGYAFLEATREALTPPRPRIAVVVHDLHRHGAQFLALNMAKTLRERFGYDVATVACGRGDLAEEFEKLGPLHYAARDTAAALARGLAEEGYERAFVNSAASGWMTAPLAAAGVACVGLVHELPKIIETMKLEDGVRAMNDHARAVVFPSTVVRDRVGAALGLEWRNPAILPQGLYARKTARREEARARVLARLRLDPQAEIVLGVGYGDHRKGLDIFTRWALALARKRPNAAAIWLGGVSPDMQEARDLLLSGEPQETRRRILFPGFVADPSDYYAAADLYALTSREDPFPSTALEALAAGTPVFMIAGTGGIEDLAAKGCVATLPDEDDAAFADAAGRLLEDPARRAQMGRAGRDLIRAEFGFASYIGELLRASGAAAPRVSAVVPSYNYARHLPERIGSILRQTPPPYEIVVLDDASTDDSLAVAERLLDGADVRCRIVANERNSGDVFAQWRKGVGLAAGDYVWIAEADDFADPEFLETALAGFADPEVVLSYTQSRQVNERGEVIGDDYLDYVADIGGARWRRSYVNDGEREIVEALSVKNTIPNVSAAVFRRAAIARTLDERVREVSAYRVAGDWCVYVNLLRAGKIAFNARALNNHRRHEASVTISRFTLAELGEIARMQAYVAREFAVPPERAQAARAYLDSLVRHFRLRQKFASEEIERAIA